MKKILCYILLIISNAYCGEGYRDDGLYLIQAIKSHNKEANRTPLDSFLDGFLGGKISGILHAGNHVWFSVPQGVNVEQIVAVVQKYLSDHPKKLNEPSNQLIFEALTDAYPLTPSDAESAIASIKSINPCHQ